MSAPACDFCAIAEPDALVLVASDNAMICDACIERSARIMASKRAERRPSAVYVASRASVPDRPAMWQRLRAEGWDITSTWIDEAGPGETANMAELWQRIVREISAAVGLVLYVEADDLPLKGALLEAGVALGLGKRIGVVSPGVEFDERTWRPVGSWLAHPLVCLCASLEAARSWATSVPA